MSSISKDILLDFQELNGHTNAMAAEVVLLEGKGEERMHYEEAISLLIEMIDEKRGPKKITKSNPAVVGLAGFGLTTMVLQFHNIGWMESIGPVIWLGLIFGGLAQLIAGMQEYGTGNNFAYCAFTTYGSFWIALALMLIANNLDFYKSYEEDIGWFLVAFTLFTLIMWIASFGINTALCVTFFLLLLGFVFLDIVHFDHHLKGFQQAAGWVLLACACGAWYCMSHVLFKDAFVVDVIPVGPAPFVFLKRKLGNRN